ncbi:MAG: hypothetical protein OCD02_12300 [Spirochaetaceae bacterium]
MNNLNFVNKDKKLGKQIKDYIGFRIVRTSAGKGYKLLLFR